NVAIPVMGNALLESIRLLSNSMRVLADKTIDGLLVNQDRAKALAESSPAIVTPLNKVIGYEAAAKIAKHAVANSVTVKQAALDLGYVDGDTLSLEQLDQLLAVLPMTRPPQ
ncbi:MAG: aspartate ammonia-lyase, partial [Aquiluna sp.]